MPLEVEMKFPVDDFKDITSSLSRAGARLKENLFEKNIVYDTCVLSLKEKSSLLRLRQTGEYCLLTLKRKTENDEDKKIKTRIENQVLVSEFAQTDLILKGLGYEPVLEYEKFRKTYELDKSEICLDTVSFGRFVEIEASRENIFNVARTLGLDENKAMSKSYHQLNREFNEDNGLDPNPSFVFDFHERQKLALELGCDINWLSTS